MRLFIYVVLLGTLLISACSKENVFTTDPSAKLYFSTDSILFDTLFTSVGSTTRRLKVFNPNKKSVHISEIKLGGGSSSSYQININGQAVNQVSGIDLAGNDSLYLFVKVNINPTNASSPFVVADSILFQTNGNLQKIQLAAYGQNAVFFHNKVINQDEIWDKTLPYVIMDSVTVNENVKLTIKEGTKIYFHKGSKLLVSGSLHVEGLKNDTVTFLSDRFERIYQEEPGQWNGIHLLQTSTDNQINFALIKNALIGIQVNSLAVNNNPKLLLTNCIIKNMEVAGIAMFNTEVKAFNNLFYNCGQFLTYGVGGGIYDFKQNTFAALNINFSRKTPAVYFADFLTKNNATETASLEVHLTNNIIWGSLDEELVFEKKGAVPLNINLTSNLIKTKTASFNNGGNIINEDPLFSNPRNEDYTLIQGSPCIDKGADLTADPYFNPFLMKDLKDKPRSFPSELGCYELN
jgi:hypothetical protein